MYYFGFYEYFPAIKETFPTENAVCSVYFRSKINSFLFYDDSQDNLIVCNNEVYMTQLRADSEKYNILASERHEICT